MGNLPNKNFIGHFPSWGSGLQTGGGAEGIEFFSTSPNLKIELLWIKNVNEIIFTWMGDLLIYEITTSFNKSCISQGGGGYFFSIYSQVQGGRGGSQNLGWFPKFYRLLVLMALKASKLILRIFRDNFPISLTPTPPLI